MTDSLATYIDHTLLKPEAQRDAILALCAEAREHRFKAVCVNAGWLPEVVEALAGSDVTPCAVVGFPLGAGPGQSKAAEAADAIRAGAREIDMVIAIGRTLDNDWDAVSADIAAVQSACGDVPLKVIFETPLLNIERQLKDEGVKQGSCIRVLPVDNEIIHLVIKPAGESSYSLLLNVEASTLIKDLKHQIEEKIEVPMRNQSLYYRDVLLRNMKRISDYQISDQTQLTLTCSVEISIETLDSRHMALIVEHTTTVESLKVKAEETFGIPASRQRLICQREELRNSQSLSESSLGLLPTRPIRLVIAERKLMWVFIHWNEQVFNVKLSPSDTFLEMKREIYKITSVPVEQQRIFHQNIRLEGDDALLETFGISELAKLILHEMQTFIRFVVRISNTSRFEISAEESDTVADVKNKVESLSGISSVDQRYLLHGNALDDGSRLSESGVRNNSIIVVVLGAGKMEVTMKSVCGHLSRIPIKQSDNLEDVKCTISEQIGVDSHLLRLFIESNEWKNPSTKAWEEHIDSKSAVYVARQDHESFWLFVAAGGTMIGVVAHPTDSFQQVKSRIQGGLGVEEGRVVFQLDRSF